VSSERVKTHTKRATSALAELKRAKTIDEQLAAARTLESAACQLRRALKSESA
jgi:hypothetical protein